MIAKFLNERCAVSSNLNLLKEKLQEFKPLWYAYSKVDTILSDGKPGNWFCGAYNEGEEDSGKFLCFSCRRTRPGDAVVDSIVISSLYDNGTFRRKHPNDDKLFLLNKTFGLEFSKDDKEAAKRSSLFVRNLVKKMASLSSWEDMAELMMKSSRDMKDFDWENEK